MAEIAAFLDKTNKDICVLVTKTTSFKKKMHSIQSYAERFMDELLILNSGPGEIELNPDWSWRFIVDDGFYTIDLGVFSIIPMYKEQQH